MKRLMAGTLACAASLALTTAAQAAPQKFYFGCGGQTPITNLTPATAAWSPTAPTGTMQSGSGCGSLVYENQDVSYGGSYGGEVRTVDLELYGIVSNPVYRTLLPGISLDVTITAGNKTVYEGTEVPFDTSAGALPGGFKATTSITDIDVPASDTAKSWTITVDDPFVDDPYTLGAGASDAPASVTFKAWDDLTCEQQAAIDDTVVCDGEPA